MGLAVAIVGASGLVGREVLALLDERQFPADSVRLLGSPRTAGGEVERAGRPERIELLGPEAFAGIDLVFFTAGMALAGEYAPLAAAAGGAVIDSSPRFRLDDAVPLVVAEVNPAMLVERRERGIVASPSSTAVALSMVLAPLVAQAGLRRVVVSTYQSVSGVGRRGLDALSRETIDLMKAQAVRRRRFGRRIAFNCVPRVGAVEPGGATTHELQAVEEVRKVLGDPALALSATAVRVPVFYGHAFSVHLVTEQPLDADAATELLRSAPGLLVPDAPSELYPTPAEVIGSDATHVGRIRNDPAVEHGLALWIALDNVRRGAALNAVAIAEILLRDYW